MAANVNHDYMSVLEEENEDSILHESSDNDSDDSDSSSNYCVEIDSDWSEPEGIFGVDLEDIESELNH